MLSRQSFPSNKGMTVINKLTEEQHNEYLELLEKAKKDRLSIVHCRELIEHGNAQGEYEAKGGVTGVVGEGEFKNSYSRLAVTICGPNELFVRKVGNYFALKAFYAGQTIPFRPRDLGAKEAAYYIMRNV